MKQTLIRYTVGCLFNVHFVPIACTNRKRWLQTQPSLYLLRYWTDLLSYRRQEAVEVQVLSNNSHRKNLDTQSQTSETCLCSSHSQEKINPILYVLCQMQESGYVHIHTQESIYVSIYVRMERKGEKKISAYVILLILLVFSDRLTVYCLFLFFTDIFFLIPVL